MLSRCVCRHGKCVIISGEKILSPLHLQPAPTETLYRGKEEHLHNQFHDVSQYEILNGKIRAQYTMENESGGIGRLALRTDDYGIGRTGRRRRGYDV